MGSAEERQIQGFWRVESWPVAPAQDEEEDEEEEKEEGEAA